MGDVGEQRLAGNLYRHLKTGRHYRVEMDSARMEATGERAVVYRGLADNQVWVRPYDEFVDGRFELATGE